MPAASLTTRGHRLERPRRLCRALALLAAALGILIFGTVFPASAQTVAIEPRYEAVGHFHEGLAPAKLNGAWGFIDRTGAWIVEPQYESVYRGADGRFGVKQNGLWGFISTAGTLVIEPRYKEIRPFSDGVARVRENDDGWFYIFPSGERESDQVFIDATDRVDGLAMVKTEIEYTGQIWSILDPRGGLINVWTLPQKEVTGCLAFSEGFAIAQTARGSIYIDAKGETLFNAQPIPGGRRSPRASRPAATAPSGAFSTSRQKP